jgi:acyl-coenzyme A synthetase/AMP-(fatty) acid ligase
MGPPLPSLHVRTVAGEVAVQLAESPYLAGDAGRWRDGWLYTGDRGELRDGVLWIGGRSDSVLAVGGMKVDLTEVEDVLAAHPQVRAAVVVGTGQSVEAFVEAELVGAAELHDWCRQRLSGYKRPRRIVVTSRLPRTSNGKLARAAAALAAVSERPA